MLQQRRPAVRSAAARVGGVRAPVAGLRWLLVWLCAVLSSVTVAADDSLMLTQQVQQLARDARVRAGFDAMRDGHAQAIAQMIALNEIPAPPFGEQARAERFAGMLAATGVTAVSTDSVGNVIGSRPGREGSRTVAVIAHLDTVFPADTDVRVRTDGDTYRAPGIGDNARGLALLLAMARALDAANIETEQHVLFIGSVGEEGLGDLRGARQLFDPAAASGPIHSAIVIDGGDLQRVVTRAVGSNRYRVTFRGPGGHSYGQFGRANPHQALAAAIQRFTLAAGRISAQDGAKASFSVGRIGGGTSINSIPFESWMEVDMRSVDPLRLAQLDAAFRQAVQEGLNEENRRRISGAALSMELKPVGRRPAGAVPTSAALVQRALAAQRSLGIEPVLADSSTDANIPIALGIPAVTISRGGRTRNAHAPNESWQDVDTHLAERFALLLLVAEAGLADEAGHD